MFNVDNYSKNKVLPEPHRVAMISVSIALSTSLYTVKPRIVGYPHLGTPRA